MEFGTKVPKRYGMARFQTLQLSRSLENQEAFESFAFQEANMHYCTYT
jgi:hypothetical protein